jgi:hypothetical protein
MNLLAKSLGQLALLAVALFFFSCEDPTSLGFENPTPKFNVQYVEFSLDSKVVPLEHVITDNKGNEDITVYVGQYQDPLLGKVRAEPYLQFSRGFSAKLADTTKFDSAVLRLRLSVYSYGFVGKATQRFTIHQITGDSLVRISPDPMNPIRYYDSSTIAYNPTPIGEATISVDYDQLVKNQSRQANQQDTITVTARLDSLFGQMLFAEAKTYEFTGQSDYQRFFWDQKGLVLVPVESNVGVISINALSSLSGLIVYYHNENSSNASALLYPFNRPTFTNFQTDRLGTDLEGATPHQALEPASGLRYLQTGTPIITEADLSQFYSYFDHDSLQNILINSAELVIENIDQPAGIHPVSSFTLRAMKENHHFRDSTADEDIAAMVGYYVTPNSYYFHVLPDIPVDQFSIINVNYNNTTKQSSGFITLFAQSLLKNSRKNGQINQNRLTYLGLLPTSPSLQRGVHRTAFHKDNLKLKVYYTRPTNINH